MNRKIYGERVNHFRKEAGITYKELAERAGVSVSTVNSAISNVNGIAMSTVKNILSCARHAARENMPEVETADNKIKRKNTSGIYITDEAKPRTCSPNMEDMRISNPEVAEIVSNMFQRYIRDDERPVMVKETEEIFSNISEAGRAYNINPKTAVAVVTKSCEANRPVKKGALKGKTFSWVTDKSVSEMNAFKKAMEDAGFKNYKDYMDSKAQKRTQMELHKAQFLEDMLSGNYTLTTREKIELKKALGL